MSRSSVESMVIALWHLSRPRLSACVVCLVLMGFGWAHWDRALMLRGMSSLCWIVCAWWCLSTGTLWLNADLDRDQGEVLYGTTAPVPRGLAIYGYCALAFSIQCAALAGSTPFVCGLLCVALAILYSHPKTCWKGHPVGGPFVNGVGYGLVSPLVGWSAADVAVNSRTLLMWALGCCMIMACYFVAQAFQGTEDANRGYRTLVVTHGPHKTLQVARGLFAISAVGGLALIVSGWLPRVCVVLAPALWWVDRWLVDWMRQADGGRERHARVFTKRLFYSALMCLSVVLCDYVWDSAQAQPVAGLSTTRGRPTDRPLLPPHEMRGWERDNGGHFLTH